MEMWERNTRDFIRETIKKMAIELPEIKIEKQYKQSS